VAPSDPPLNLASSPEKVYRSQERRRKEQQAGARKRRNQRKQEKIKK